MSVNRRDFLRAGASAGLAAGTLAATPRWLPALSRPAAAGPALAASPITDPQVRELAFRAVEAARAAGASYADVRLTHTRRRHFAPSDYPPILERAQRDTGVRALVDGYWGFAASTVWTPDELARLGKEAVHQAQVNALGKPRVIELGPIPVVKDGHWQHPVERDPFQVPDGEVLDFLQGLRLYGQRKSRAVKPPEDPAGITPGVQVYFRRQDKAFASSEGSYCTQRLYRTAGDFSVGLTKPGKGKIILRSPIIAGASRGWEYIHQAPLREEIERLIEEILADFALPEKPVEVGRYDIVFDAQSMASLLAGTLGCATDVARALAYRAHELGTSYLKDPLTMLGSYQAGAPLLSVQADRALPGGLATVQWDDEGVAPESFPLVQDGVLMDFQTHREGAGWLKDAYAKQGRPGRSHGCATALRAFEAPEITMPNLTLAPGTEALDFDDFVGSMKQGIAVKQGGAGMDWQCLNGLGSGRCYEVKDGKRVARLKAQFLLRAPEFWKALLALGGAASQRPFLGSGDPGSDNVASTVRAVPGVLKQVAMIRGEALLGGALE